MAARPRTRTIVDRIACACWAALLVCVAAAADSNIPYPIAELEQRLAQESFTLEQVKQSRQIKGDVSLRADVRFADGLQLRIKIRRATPGADEFNNQPRYEMAAYSLQKLFLDPDDYVVPPTVLRALPLAMLKPYAAEARPTFSGTGDVISVVQFWLSQVAGPATTFDTGRFASDAGYKRHAADLNVLTYLIRHGDSNAGNILVSTDKANPRLFAVDNGVAFASPAADRGTFWRSVQVPSLRAATVSRLRALSRADFTRQLSAVAQFERRGNALVAVPTSATFGASRGVRRNDPVIQMGLTTREIAELDKRRIQLLRMVDSGKVGTF